MEQHKGKRARKPTLKVKLPSGGVATASARTKPPKPTDRKVSSESFQEGREGPEPGVPLNASASAATAPIPAYRGRPRSEAPSRMPQRQQIAKYASLPPGPVEPLYPVLPGAATREATPIFKHESGERQDRQGSLESDGRFSPVITIPESPPRPQRRPWSCCRWTVYFILAELILFGSLLWPLHIHSMMQAPAEVAAPARTSLPPPAPRPRQDGDSFSIFNTSITSLAEATVSLGSMDKQADDDDDILGSMRNLHSMLVDERVMSLSLGREYNDNIVPACDSALTAPRSSSAFTYLSSKLSPTYTSTVLLLTNLGDAATVLHSIRDEVERKEGDAAVRFEQAKTDLVQSSSWWRLFLASLSDGESTRWKTHRDTWESVLTQLDAVKEDVKCVERYWRLLAQAAKELNEALEMETDKVMLEGGMRFCDALVKAAEANIGKEEGV